MEKLIILAFACLLMACGPSFQGKPTVVVDPPPAQEQKPEFVSEDSPGENGLALLLKPPSVFGRVFFANELEPLMEALVAEIPKATTMDLFVVPPRELLVIQNALRAGTMPGSGTTCTAPPVPFALFTHAYPDAGKADVRVVCEKTCILTVEVNGPNYENNDGRTVRDELVRLEATLAKDGTVADWMETLHRIGLRKVAPLEYGNGGLRVGRNSKIPDGVYEIAVSDVVQEGSWAEELDTDFFEAQVKVLHACTRGAGRTNDYWLQPFIVEVKESGHITRCESKFQHRLDPVETECQCGLLKGMDFGEATGLRRAQFVIHTWLGGENNAVRNAPTYTMVTAELQADDGSAILTGEMYDRKDIGACVSHIQENMEIAFDVFATVDAAGLVTYIEYRWPSSMDIPARQCIDKVMKRARFNCPVTGQAKVEGTMRIRQRVL